jgi:hypothetical protein
MTQTTVRAEMAEETAPHPRGVRLTAPAGAPATSSAVPSWVWLLAHLVLIAWVITRVGGFDLFTTVNVPQGAVQVVNTFAAVDHPFHATRAYSLLQSIEHGETLRWISNLQGGYPVEFYPLGFAWLEVGLWAFLFGTLPIIAVHKLAVLLVFVLPAVAYWILARADRLSPATSFLGLAALVAVPGKWTQGGYTELVQWGLATNVAGAVAALIAIAALAAWTLRGHRGFLLLAALMSAAAAYTNPRSLLAVAIAALAVLLGGALPGGASSISIRLSRSFGRVAVVGVCALLLAAPELIALMRFRDLYYFVLYQEYANLHAYWQATVQSVSAPVVALAAAGGFIGLVSPRFPAARMAILALIGYMLVTAALANPSNGAGPISQLETPRLMPFQRMLMIYLAAFGVIVAASWLARAIRAPLAAEAAGAIVAVAVLIVFVWPWPGVPASYHGLTPVPTTGNAEFAQFRQAMAVADDAAPAGTAILVIGSPLNGADTMWWHEQMWAPLETDHPLFYDDWLWYWQTQNKGPYDPLQGHAYPEPAQAITRDYFTEHGIGAVVVGEKPGAPGVQPRVAAANSPDLDSVEKGDWDVYTVRNPMPIITDGAISPDAIEIGNQRYRATFDNAVAGEIVVRRNWFPRWTATVNGQPAKIIHRDDGYMAIAAPAGHVVVDVRYGVDAVDWMARALAITGAILLALVVLSPRSMLRRWRMGWMIDQPGSSSAEAQAARN